MSTEPTTQLSVSPPLSSSDLLGRRIYACLSACATLELAAAQVLGHRKAEGWDDSKYMELLEECVAKADTARNDADRAMHELGIGYHQIYGPSVRRPNSMISPKSNSKSLSQ